MFTCPRWRGLRRQNIYQHGPYKVAGPSAHGVLDLPHRSLVFFIFDLRLIFINPCRAREPRLGSHDLKTDYLASSRPAPGDPSWRFCSSLGRPRAHMDRFLGAPATLQKPIHFGYPSNINKNGVAVRLVRLLAALDAPKVKMDPNMGLKGDILGPQNGHN